MHLKRVFHQDKLVRDENRKVVEVLPQAVRGVKVLRAKERQNFSTRIVERASAEGWLGIMDGKIYIKALEGEEVVDLVYRIERAPGLYCCHCQKRLDDSGSAQVHVAAAHAGVTSPDPSNPAGYRKDNIYVCVKE